MPFCFVKTFQMEQNVAAVVLSSSKAFYLVPNQTLPKSNEDSSSTDDCSDILFSKCRINLVPFY